MPSAKACIFCGRYDGLSKEHIWPKWMASYLPIPSPNAHISQVHSGIPKQPHTLQSKSERPGPVHTKKVRAVCHKCNNTWMSAIEEEAKPVLLRAFTSGAFTVEPSEASHLANWAVLKAVVGEHASVDHLTPYEDRSALRTSRKLPWYFRVFAANHHSATQTAYLRHSATLSLSLAGPVPGLPKGISRNIQVTTLLIGPICLHIAALRLDGVNTTLLDPIRPMRLLHPAHEGSLGLESMPTLTDIDLQFNSEAVERLIRNPRVKYGGELPIV